MKGLFRKLIAKLPYLTLSLALVLVVGFYYSPPLCLRTSCPLMQTANAYSFFVGFLVHVDTWHLQQNVFWLLGVGSLFEMWPLRPASFPSLSRKTKYFVFLICYLVDLLLTGTYYLFFGGIGFGASFLVLALAGFLIALWSCYDLGFTIQRVMFGVALSFAMVAYLSLPVFTSGFSTHLGAYMIGFGSGSVMFTWLRKSKLNLIDNKPRSA